MPYELKPLSCKPGAIAGMSEKIIVSHYENNYGGAVNLAGRRSIQQRRGFA